MSDVSSTQNSVTAEKHSNEVPSTNDEIVKLLKDNPEVEEKIVKMVVQAQQENYSSPFPHPDHLERFTNLYPDAAKIVFDCFQKQNDHRIETEKKIVEQGTKFDLRAQIFGFLTVILLVCASIYCMSQGWHKFAGAILLFGVAPIVTSYFGKTFKKTRNTKDIGTE